MAWFGFAPPPRLALVLLWGRRAARSRLSARRRARPPNPRCVAEAPRNPRGGRAPQNLLCTCPHDAHPSRAGAPRPDTGRAAPRAEAPRPRGRPKRPRKTNACNPPPRARAGPGPRRPECRRSRGHKRPARAAAKGKLQT